MVKTVLWYVKPFLYNTGACLRDGQTDGRTDRIAIVLSISISGAIKCLRMFIHFDTIHEPDRQTKGHPTITYAAPCMSSRGKKNRLIPDFYPDPEMDPNKIEIGDNAKMYCMCTLAFSWKLADHCVRNASHCRRMPTAVLRKGEKWSWTNTGIRSTPKFNPFWSVTRCQCLPSLVDVQHRVRELSCGQTDRHIHGVITIPTLPL